MMLEYTFRTFLQAGLFILLGLTLTRFLHLRNRNKESKRTPYPFDFKFWIKDNWQVILSNLIINFLIVYWFPHFEVLLSKVAESYTTLNIPTDFWFFALGITNDLVLSWVKRLLINLRKLVP